MTLLWLYILINAEVALLVAFTFNSLGTENMVANIEAILAPNTSVAIHNNHLEKII